MIFPTVHINGTPLLDLMKAHEQAYAAIKTALDALCECRPNGRDYYPQGPEMTGKAQHEAILRESKLVAVLDEVGEMIYHLEQENRKRAVPYSREDIT